MLDRCYQVVFEGKPDRIQDVYSRITRTSRSTGNIEHSQAGSYLRPWRDADLPRLFELHDQLTAVAGVDAPRGWGALHDRLAGRPQELVSVWSTGEIEARVRERIAELELDVAEPPPTPRWRTRRTL